MEKLYKAFDDLISYGLNKGLIDKDEVIYSRNLILDLFKEDEYVEQEFFFRSFQERLNDGYATQEILAGMSSEDRGQMLEKTCVCA